MTQNCLRTLDPTLSRGFPVQPVLAVLAAVTCWLGSTARGQEQEGLPQHAAIIFADDFEAWDAQSGPPPDSKWRVRHNKTSRTQVIPGAVRQGGIDGPGRQVLEIACWTEGSGSQVGGLSLKLGNYDHANEGLGDGYDELYIRYYLKLDETYRGVRNHGANLGGRDVTRSDAAWVGMAGIRDVSTRGYFYSGVQPYGKQGSEALEMGFYSYHLDKRGPWGENYEVLKHIPIKPGTWHCIERHLKLNSVNSTRKDPANADGMEELWIDGERTIRKEGVRFRRVPHLHLTLFSLETYYHGLPERFSREKPIRVYVDNLVIARNYVGLWSGDAPERLGKAEPVQWEPCEIRLTAAQDHAWWTFPVTATIVHPATDSRLKLEGCWDGGRQWLIRVAFPWPGTWRWETASADPNLNGQRGKLEVRAPTAQEIATNANYRGQLRIGADGRAFAYGDGTPFFLLADTLWAGNTARCGLGTDQDGPFFQHLADRKEKGFTAIMMQYFHGYGDYPNSAGHRNEAGYPYRDIKTKTLNPMHFQALDQRMQGLWERGFVAAIPTTWWGKTKNCVFTPEDACRMSAYCAVRYGAFNALWSLSGEYQYTFGDCGWTADDITALGQEVQRHNPYRHPLSIHPSGAVHWKPPHNVQSSRPFHGQPWLDHHWLQTGQSQDRLWNIERRLAENRALMPATPVFCSEAFYERVGDPNSAYHTRWQVWTAFLNGAAGFGYGARGVWQFFDPNDPHGEPGKKTSEVVPWHQAARLPGSSQVIHARKLLTSFEWWRLEPQREALLVDGSPNPRPTGTDLSPPHSAAIPGQLRIVYIPRGNLQRSFMMTQLRPGTCRAEWFDPRNGQAMPIQNTPQNGPEWVLPPRPAPAQEDWVLLLHRTSSR